MHKVSFGSRTAESRPLSHRGGNKRIVGEGRERKEERAKGEEEEKGEKGRELRAHKFSKVGAYVPLNCRV